VLGAFLFSFFFFFFFSISFFSYLSDSKPKQVTFFLAQISDFGKINPGEGINYAWLSPESALERVAFRSMQGVITKATEELPELVKAKLAKLIDNPSAPSERYAAPRGITLFLFLLLLL